MNRTEIVAWLGAVTGVLGLSATLYLLPMQREKIDLETKKLRIELERLSTEVGQSNDRVDKRIDEQEKKIEKLEGCYGVIGKISEPINGQQVSSRVYVSGMSTIHETCQYVFIFVRDISTPRWLIADLVQVNADGRWAGMAQVREISGVNGEVVITARVTARPTDYGVGQFLSTPPGKGIPLNNTVHVRRIR